VNQGKQAAAQAVYDKPKINKNTEKLLQNREKRKQE